MTELFRQARMGWVDYIHGGKLVALLLAALLFLWFARKWREQAGLLIYTAVMAVCCILPVTAVLPMLYQTRFYGYEWIWSMVPLTAVAAYGATVFISEYWKDFDGRQWKRGLPVAVLLAVAILFCGSMGGQAWDRQAQRAEREKAFAVLEEIREKRAGADICLWAPREILEHAREIDAGCRLIYGRNMWEPSLSAYAYDVYDEETMSLYRWMEGIGEEREAESLADLEGSVEKALSLGADCIMLPADALPETVGRMEKALGAKAEPIEGYLVWMD